MRTDSAVSVRCRTGCVATTGRFWTQIDTGRRGDASAMVTHLSPAGMKPFSDEVRRMSPFGSPKGDGQYDSNEAQRRRRSVVRLIHPTAEPMPVSTDAGVRGISRRSGFGGTWMARYR